MPNPRNHDEIHWFVLNFVRPSVSAKPQQYIDAFNRGTDRLELFAPTIRSAEVVDGKVVFKEKMLTFFYVFVRGTLNDVKTLCATDGNGFSFVLDRSSEHRYGIVSDAAMAGFRLVARLYSNTLPFYDIADIELEEGDIVEVVDGPYAGLTGTFMPRSRSTRGNLVIAATAVLGTVVWDIDARYVRILRFAPDTRRQYDILDAFIPRLLPVMRRYHAGEALTPKDNQLLTVFSRRMGAVIIDNHKLEAKLLATLMCVRAILGDMAGYDDSAQRYEKRRTAVTNTWTRALIALMLAIATGDMRALPLHLKDLEAATPAKPTATQTTLLAEYHHYLDTAASIPRSKSDG